MVSHIEWKRWKDKNVEKVAKLPTQLLLTFHTSITRILAQNDADFGVFRRWTWSWRWGWISPSKNNSKFGTKRQGFVMFILFCFQFWKFPFPGFPFLSQFTIKEKQNTKIFRAKKYPISKQSDENLTKNIAFVTTTISGLPQICLKPRNFASFGRQIWRTGPTFLPKFQNGL